jgi:hypothetical protein
MARIKYQAVLASVILAIGGSVIFQSSWATDSSLKAQLQSRYAAMKSAMAAHNKSAIAAILAPDFVSIDINGQSEGADQMIEEVSALKPDPNKTSTTTLESIAPSGNSVTVKQRYDMNTVKAGDDGAQHKVQLITRSTDQWIRVGGVWLLERTVTNEMSYYKDGRLITHR